MPPTFDEWYKSKYGNSFDECNFIEGMRIDWAMRNLADHMREYVTEMVRNK